MDLLVIDHCGNDRCNAAMLYGDQRQPTAKYCSAACRKAVQMRGYRTRHDTPDKDAHP